MQPMLDYCSNYCRVDYEKKFLSSKEGYFLGKQNSRIVKVTKTSLQHDDIKYDTKS